MSKPLHVLQVINSLEVGGAERALLRLVRGLRKKGIAVTVIQLEQGEALREQFIEAGAKVEDLGVSGYFGLVSGVVRYRALLKRLRPHIVHSWMYHSNVFCALCRWIFRHDLPLMWGIRATVRGLNDDRWPTRLLLRMSVLLSGQAAKVVCNSEESLRQHLELGYLTDKVMYVPNGFLLPNAGGDGSRTVLKREILGIPGGAPVIGVFARYHRQKGYDLFFASLPELLKQHPELQVICVGRGVIGQNPEVFEMITQSGLERIVHLLGERDDVGELMEACDIVCLPSRWGESFPNVIGEAMSRGLPCVATDLGVAAELLEGCGELVPVEDTAGLTVALEKVLSLTSSQRRELGERGRQRIEEEFSLERFVDQHVALYEQLVS